MVANGDSLGANFPDSGASVLLKGDLWGPIISTVRGFEIRLDQESIYRIFYIASIGLRVYESKIWPTVLGFKLRKAI